MTMNAFLTKMNAFLMKIQHNNCHSQKTKSSLPPPQSYLKQSHRVVRADLDNLGLRPVKGGAGLGRAKVSKQARVS